MYAIVRTGGKQYQVACGDQLRVEKINGNVGDIIELNDVLMVVDGDNAQIGRPVLENAKVVAKIAGVYPGTRAFASPRKEGMYTTLLMSTGLTFGTISALCGLSHGIVTREQYSLLVAVVIASAVIPTLIATFVFLPHHLLAKVSMLDEEEGAAAGPVRAGGQWPTGLSRGFSRTACAPVVEPRSRHPGFARTRPRRPDRIVAAVQPG